MHELSIASGIVDIVRQYVPAEGHPSVRAVRVRVGALSAVVPESLEFSFAAITAGTPLDRASLIIERVPVRIRCNACRYEFTTDVPVFVCPRCAGGDSTMLQGNELQVVEIELEDHPVETS